MQLQAWNAIDTATPIEMIGKTALNLLWFTVLARTLSTIFKQYVQASREFLLQLKEKQLSGNNNQVFSEDLIMFDCSDILVCCEHYAVSSKPII